LGKSRCIRLAPFLRRGIEERNPFPVQESITAVEAELYPCPQGVYNAPGVLEQPQR
jgi:hypothetical protein